MGHATGGASSGALKCLDWVTAKQLICVAVMLGRAIHGEWASLGVQRRCAERERRGAEFVLEGPCPVPGLHFRWRCCLIVDRRKHDSWELVSWRGMQVLPCPENLREEMQSNLPKVGTCLRMLTELPTKDRVECSLSALAAITEPEAGLQVMGISSVRSGTG